MAKDWMVKELRRRELAQRGELRQKYERQLEELQKVKLEVDRSIQKLKASIRTLR
jgi:hypothetical protein